MKTIPLDMFLTLILTIREIFCYVLFIISHICDMTEECFDAY